MAETNGLFPTVDIPDFVEEKNNYDTKYRPSPSWDLQKGDFVRNASGKVPMTDGKTAYKLWCIKCVATERTTCLAYADDLGTEMESATRISDRDAVELAIRRTITEALMVNPRTQDVDGFTFRWDGGSVYVSFTVTGVDDEEFDVETKISADE